MNQLQQRILESLQRVLDFLNTYVLGTINTSPGRQDVQTAVDTAEAHQVKQGSATRTLSGQMSRQQSLGKELIAQHMRPIRKFARAKLRGVPEFADMTAPVTVKSPKKLLANARTLADVAAKYSDQMTAAGLAPDTIARLTAATNAYADAIGQRVHAKGLRSVSTPTISSALAAGRDGVNMLDALITQQLPANDPLLTAWTSISRVESKPGKVRAPKPATPATPATTVTPATPSAPSTAALVTKAATVAAPVATTAPVPTTISAAPQSAAAPVTTPAVTATPVTPIVSAVSPAPSPAAAPATSATSATPKAA